MRTVQKKALGARCAVLGVAALLAAGVQAELPDTHRQVKYVESDGTQYINTGVTATKNARLVMKFSYTVADEGGGGVGYAANGSAQSFRFWRSKEENTGTPSTTSTSTTRTTSSTPTTVVRRSTPMSM